MIETCPEIFRLIKSDRLQLLPSYEIQKFSLSNHQLKRGSTMLTKIKIKNIKNQKLTNQIKQSKIIFVKPQPQYHHIPDV